VPLSEFLEVPFTKDNMSIHSTVSAEGTRHVQRIPLFHSLRVRLILASLAVEITLLSILVFNNLRLQESSLVEQAQLRLTELNSLLNAAIAGPLAARDFGTMQDILDEVRHREGVVYLALIDNHAKIVAAAGWDNKTPLPPIATHNISESDGSGRYDAEVVVHIGTQRYGKVQYGLSTEFLNASRSSVLKQSLLIAGVEIALSFFVLWLVGYWLTRHLALLSNASGQVTAGNFDIHLPVKSNDEIGQLTAAFNLMSKAVRERMADVQNAAATQHELAQQTLQDNARLSALLSTMTVGILFEDAENRIVYANTMFRRIWLVPDSAHLVGLPTTEALRQSANILAQPDHFSRHLLEVLGTREVSDSFEICTADGRILTQLSYPVRDANDRFIGRLWIYEDITHERQTAEELMYLAERDSLTGLFNRHRFQIEIDRAMEELKRHNTVGAVLFFDLDEFKYINDTYGHRAGDAMLIRVAGEISHLVRRNETLSRLGGDEFAVLVPGADEKSAVQLAERIIRGVSQIPFRFEGHSLRLTTSVGIALYPQHGGSVEELISRADAAMYQAKEAGKDAWRLYQADRDASREMLNRLTWQERLTNALDNKLLRLHFQGVYQASNLQLSHFEALVRIVDESEPSRLILPGQFITHAERTGKIVDIDRWVIRECVSILARDKKMPSLAVNISGRSFDDPSMPQYIANQLAQAGVAPYRLLVELTETSAVSDLHDAQRFIEALQRTGCKVCLDDFGAGFSSFAYLKHIKADILKIDGMFVRDLPNDRDNQVFVKSIVDVARGMKKTTIAEFVETEETLVMLRKMGVDMVQGYHMGVPVGDPPELRLPA